MNEEICQNLMECESILKSYQYDFREQCASFNLRRHLADSRERLEAAQKAKKEKCVRAYVMNQCGKSCHEIATTLKIGTNTAKTYIEKGKEISDLEPICLYKAKEKERRGNPRSQIEAENARRTRAKLAYSLKQEGKTYKEIGIFFGVSSSRAKVLSDKGQFYATGKRS